MAQALKSTVEMAGSGRTLAMMVKRAIEMAPRARMAVALLGKETKASGAWESASMVAKAVALRVAAARKEAQAATWAVETES